MYVAHNAKTTTATTTTTTICKDLDTICCGNTHPLLSIKWRTMPCDVIGDFATGCIARSRDVVSSAHPPPPKRMRCSKATGRPASPYGLPSRWPGDLDGETRRRALTQFHIPTVPNHGAHRRIDRAARWYPASPSGFRRTWTSRCVRPPQPQPQRPRPNLQRIHEHIWNAPEMVRGFFLGV